MDEHILNQIQKNSDDIESLRVQLYSVDKNQSAISINITFLSENIQKLSISVDRIYEEMKSMHEKISPMQHYMQNNKGFFQTIKENWIHIPTALAIVGAFYYGVTYFNKYFTMI
jgi:hypothetical protein